MDKEYLRLKQGAIAQLVHVDKDILQKTIENIEEYGLIKGKYIKWVDEDTPSYCLVGHLNVVTDSDVYTSLLGNPKLRIMTGPIYYFNDYKLTNKQRVISALKTAIKQQEKTNA